MPRLLSGFLALALASPFALAQPGAQTTPPPPGTTPPPAGAPPSSGKPGPPGLPPSDVDITVRQRPSLSPQEMIGQSREYRIRMAEVSSRIEALIETARKAKDIILIDCLSDKLVQVKGSIEIADKAFQAMQEAIAKQEAMAKKDDGASLHEYTRITILNQKVQVLGGEADLCVGEDLLGTTAGATRIIVEVTGNMTKRDTTRPDPPITSFNRPPPASPFK